jgi:hypothetical protein
LHSAWELVHCKPNHYHTCCMLLVLLSNTLISWCPRYTVCFTVLLPQAIA